MENGAGRFLTHARRQYCNFPSNDYLGLSQHPTIVRAPAAGGGHYGVGSGGAGARQRLSDSASGAGRDACRLAGLSARAAVHLGFAANQAVIAALIGKDDRIAADRLSHASLLEAASSAWHSCGALPTTMRFFARHAAG